MDTMRWIVFFERPRDGKVEAVTLEHDATLEQIRAKDDTAWDSLLAAGFTALYAETDWTPRDNPQATYVGPFTPSKRQKNTRK